MNDLSNPTVAIEQFRPKRVLGVHYPKVPAEVVARARARRERLVGEYQRQEWRPANQARFDIEHGRGVDPIEVIQQLRREAMAELAVLSAHYERRGGGASGSPYEERRKRLRSALMTQIKNDIERHNQGIVQRARSISLPKEKKEFLDDNLAKVPSEAELERLANLRPELSELTEEAEGEYAVMLLLANEVQDYNELINRDQRLLKEVSA